MNQDATPEPGAGGAIRRSAACAIAGLRTTVDAALAAVLAPCCAACRLPLELPLDGPVCARCWRALRCIGPPVCENCGDVLARPDGVRRCRACSRRSASGTPIPVSAARALGPYEGVLREAVHALKYDGRRSLAAPLARLLHDAWGGLLDDADALVPVPLHPWRHWRRGFNQADEIARAVADLRGLPVVRALRRTRATRPQQQLDAPARALNVQGAFALAGLTRRGRHASARHVRGRVLVLVDDVLTTGATLDACAHVLQTAGAKDVRAITLARVVLS